jgi:hypothetical protein
MFCLMEGWLWCGNRSCCSSDRPSLRRDRRDPPPGLGSGLIDRIVSMIVSLKQDCTKERENENRKEIVYTVKQLISKINLSSDYSFDLIKYKQA